MPNTKIDLGNGLILNNPILTASGTFGYGEEFENLFDLGKLGGIVTKAITPEFRSGNAIPRICETECGMINSIGLANVGLETFIKNKLEIIKRFKTVVFINVAGKNVNDYVEVARELDKYDFIEGIEVNISCPNVKEGGHAFGASAKVAAEVTREVRKVYKKHMMLKLSPNVTDITEIAKACEGEGADSVSLINTLYGMAIDTNTFESKVKSKVAGYSGPGIKPIALAHVYKTSQAVKIPVIGLGGIRTHLDVVEFMLAGASAIQIGTANFTDPLTSVKVIDKFEQFLIDRNIENASDLIGAMKG